MNNGKTKTIAKDTIKALAPLTCDGSSNPLDLQATTPTITDPRSKFAGHQLTLDFLVDETQTTLNTARSSPIGANLVTSLERREVRPSRLAVRSSEFVDERRIESP
jgi:hypothetical protein